MDIYHGNALPDINGKHLYYCVSQESLREYILSFDEDIDDNPELVQDWNPPLDAYPLGTFLLRCINFAIKCAYISDKRELPSEIIEQMAVLYFEKYFIKAEVMRDYDSNDEFNLLASLIVSDFKAFESPYTKDAGFIKINNYVNFAMLCNRSREFCSVREFHKFSILNNEILNSAMVVPIEALVRGNGENKWHYKTIQRALKSAELMKENSFWNIMSNMLGDEYISGTYHYYKINSITQFLSAAFQEIFSAKKIIKKCGYCFDFFIPRKRSDTKYCDGFNPYCPDRSCSAQAKLERQLESVQASESRKIYNSIRTMMESRVKNNNDENDLALRTFLQEAFDKRQEIKQMLLLEEDYIAWLKTFYRRKGKKK